jgi:glycosyltransferase involved in cell wall biosynthesis
VTDVRTVLLISPYFPPMSVVGAKRPLHLVRHLPHHGWSPVVLAGDPASENVDPSLIEAIPSSVPVSYGYGLPLRAQVAGPAGRPREDPRPLFGWDLGYLNPLDSYWPKRRAGLREARRLAAQHRVSAVVVCANPWSPLLVGAALARSEGLPFVADLRDPWSLQTAKMALRPPVTRWMVGWLEERVFRAARMVVLNTEDCRDAYIAAYRGRIPAGRFTCIRNAYDLGLFDDVTPERPGRFTVLHFGHFRRLVPAEPLLRGFARFVTRESVAPDRAALRLVGTVREEDRLLAVSLGLEAYLDIRPPVPYRDGLAQLRGADVLALVTVGGMALTVPAKLYDYMGARRPILAVTDQPEPARLVETAGAGLAAPPDDADRIADAILRLWTRCKRPDRGELPAEAVQQFGAEEQSRRLAAVLDQVSTS